MLIEELALLVFGEPVAEVLGGQDRTHEEGRMCPVENVGVQRAVAAALVVDPLDRDVVVADLRTSHRRAVAVEHHTTDRVERSQQSRYPLAEEDGVVLDRRTQLRVHVLHGAGPRALQEAAPIPEVLPGQRIRAERPRRSVIAARRHGASGCHCGAVAGGGTGLGRILTQLVTFTI